MATARPGSARVPNRRVRIRWEIRIAEFRPQERQAAANDLEHCITLREPGDCNRLLADLVLLDANPLDDIKTTMKVGTVIFRGRVFDRAALDRMLLEVEAIAK